MLVALQLQRYSKQKQDEAGSSLALLFPDDMLLSKIILSVATQLTFNHLLHVDPLLLVTGINV